MSNAVPISRSLLPRHNLPAEIASFVGRERELAEIARLLTKTRLLTLTGAGGSGKTRLALRGAAELVPRFPDGIWLVQLAPLADSSMVPRAVAAALGIRGPGGRPLLATLAAALVSRRMLLVLDNCEHLIGACARLAETLLRACPDLRVLATSREPLRVPGETTWRVPSLALPQAEPIGAQDALQPLAQVESVALFLARAQSRQPDFMLTAPNAASIVAICCQMDGLPLAIELAAAQVSTLAPEQIASRLDDALRLLGGGSRILPRHETLRATLDWSYALLSPAEAALFQRLAVFAGAFDLAAVEEVYDGVLAPVEVVSLLTALVEKSLVEPLRQPGEARFRLLEPVRQFAWAHLVAQGEADSTRRRHARYFMELAEAAYPRLMSADRGPWIERLAAEQDNLRAALTWSRHRAEANNEEECARDGEVGLRLAAALAMFWVYRGDVSEGREWIEGALAKCPDAQPNVRADALHMAGELAWLMGQYPTSRARLEESASLYRALGDKRGLAYVLQVLPMVIDEPQASAVAAEAARIFADVGDAWGAAHAAMTQAYLALARGATNQQELLATSLARWRALGDDWGVAMTLNYLGDLARQQSDLTTATAHYQESLALLRRQNMSGTVPSLLHNLGYLAVRRGEARRALRLFREGLALFRDQGDQRGIAECLVGVAGALGLLKQPERAARLLGAAEALFEETGTAASSSNAAEYARTLSVVRDQLDGPALAAAWADGRILAPERAIAEALEAGHVAAPADEVEARGLTAREREVAALVAQGLTNRQIGQTLVITEGTARLHVKHLLAKLGFASRAQIAAWAVEQGLVAAPGARCDA